MASNFNFDAQREQSAVKTEIVTKYFSAWVKVLKNKNNKLGYIDLFSGPGVYKDGAKSTPIIILENILSDNYMRDHIVTWFNEKDRDLYNELVENIKNIRDIEKLKYKPIIKNDAVDYDTPKWFAKRELIPCFSFIDPAGYMGLSLNLLKALGKDYGSDIIFFFNFNDINRGITNDKVTSHMEQVFGKSSYSALLKKIKRSPGDRETIIINEMAVALKREGMKFVLPFRFKLEGKNRTSHYLIFASKKFLGYKIMKEIMHKAGEKDYEGVGKFEFIPSCDKEKGIQLSIIDLFNSSLDELKEHLLNMYRGKSGTLERLYEVDAGDNRFLIRHYKKIILELEEEERVLCIPPRNERRPYKGKPSLNEKTVKIKFL